MLFHWTPNPSLTGWRLYLSRFGAIAGWIGWAAISIAVAALVLLELAKP